MIASKEFNKWLATKIKNEVANKPVKTPSSGIPSTKFSSSDGCTYSLLSLHNSGYYRTWTAQKGADF